MTTCKLNNAVKANERLQKKLTVYGNIINRMVDSKQKIKENSMSTVDHNIAGRNQRSHPEEIANIVGSDSKVNYTNGNTGKHYMAVIQNKQLKCHRNMSE